MAKQKDFVTKKELNEFKDKLDKDNASILDAIKSITMHPSPVQQPIHGTMPGKPFSVTKPQEEVVPTTNEQASASASNYTLNPAHQMLFEEYFDPADGFEGRMEYPYFTIIVPMKFSNADPAWKKYYKVDTRVKFLKYDNIEGGMRDWCKMVSGNLKYDKTKKLKI